MTDASQFLDDILAISVWLTKFIAAISPLLVVLAPVVIPAIAGSFRNKKHGEAFDAVTRMGLLATNTAADKIRDGLEKAAQPSSDGGSAVTQAELAAIYADAIRSAYQWAQDNHVWKNVLDVFGGEDEVKKAMMAIIRKKLTGDPASSSGPSTSAAVSSSIPTLSSTPCEHCGAKLPDHVRGCITQVAA